MNDCRTFRRTLGERLSGSPAGSADLTDLSWSEHLLGCDACRELLEAEEALELLLASLPDPQLPPHLARRVLARLRDGDPLDALLERGVAPAVPVGLSARVLHAVRERAEQDPLDALLERVPEPSVPAGLSQRVLRATAAERTAAATTEVHVGRVLQLRRIRRLVAAGVLVIGGAFAWKVLLAGPNAADQELLAHLDTLENWERLRQLSPMELEALSIDASDELLIEFGEGGR